MTDPKTIHVWMPDGRSLCDRFAEPRPRRVDELSDDEFNTHISELTDSPACGACVNLAGFVRSLAVVLLERSNGQVHPTTVRDGWAQLRGTRWDAEIDFDQFLSRDFNNDTYDALAFQINPERVREGVDAHNRAVNQMRKARETAKAGGGADPDKLRLPRPETKRKRPPRSDG